MIGAALAPNSSRGRTCQKAERERKEGDDKAVPPVSGSGGRGAGVGDRWADYVGRSVAVTRVRAQATGP